MPPVTPRRTRAICVSPFSTKPSGFVRVLDLALGDFLEGHGQVVLRAGLDERRELVEGALSELVVVVVDLASTLRSHDDQRVARVDLVEQLIDARMDHGRLMVPAAANSRWIISSNSRPAPARTSCTNPKSN